MKKIKIWKLTVLLSSIFQLISPGILTILGLSVNGNKTDGTGSSDSQLTPANYTFIIWSVIVILGFAYGVFQSLPNRKNEQLHKTLSKGLVSVYSLFVLWLVAAVMQWLLLTVLIFLAMFFLLTLLFEKVIEKRNQLDLIDKITLFGQLAVYTGWSTVAIFANTASAIKFYGLSDKGIIGLIWQTLILLLALWNGKYWLKKFNQNLVYGATIIWALVGIFFGLLQNDGNMFLRIITFLGILFVIGHLVLKQIRVQTSKGSR